MTDNLEIIVQKSYQSSNNVEAATNSATDNKTGNGEPSKTAKSVSYGESSVQKPAEGIIARNKKRELTWMEILTAAVPQRITNWAQTIMTLMRPSSENDNLKWKMTEAKADHPRNEKDFENPHQEKHFGTALDEQMAEIISP